VRTIIWPESVLPVVGEVIDAVGRVVSLPRKSVLRSSHEDAEPNRRKRDYKNDEKYLETEGPTHDDLPRGNAARQIPRVTEKRTNP
jgi:hypothetical protein